MANSCAEAASLTANEPESQNLRFCVNPKLVEESQKLALDCPLLTHVLFVNQDDVCVSGNVTQKNCQQRSEDQLN